ncbi:hypothetical protein FS837_005469, partial [Tulasnella sp. UAMH 9824]
MGSIRNLIVNRSFRSICEQGLYQNISLPYHTFRSIRLLETFLLRPDLALLVRHLEIYFNFDTGCGFSRMPDGLRVNGLGALSLAKNIRSFSLMGDVDWIWKAKKVGLRKAISKMRLVRLDVPILVDPHTGYELWDSIFAGTAYRRKISDPDVGAAIRRLLQAQPYLEEFSLSDSAEDISSRSVASLRASLQASDIPNLKSLKAPPKVPMVFLPLAARLESLDLMTTDWDDRLLSEIETKATAIKLSIRRFVIRVSPFYHDQWFWNNLNNDFALFPNLEYLSITVNSMTMAQDVKPARFYCEVIANSIHVLPSLREIEVRYETMSGNKQIFEVKTQTVVDFKMACPVLETVVDPGERLWTFRPDRQSSGLFVPFLVGSL